MQDIETRLAEWSSAGVIDDATAQRIRTWEQQHAARNAQPEAQRWQIRLALIFGAVLSSAGILLFVAAHWDNIGPGMRLSLVVGILALLHAGGILLRERFHGLSVTLHAIGTVSLGAAIALVGQIFNIESHWPNAILMWALGALAGWYLLRDATQKALSLLLLPAWLLCEMESRMSPYQGGAIYLTRLILLLAALYLVHYLVETNHAVGGWLFAAGAIAIPFSTVLLTDGWRPYNFYFGLHAWGFVPLGLRTVWLLLVLGILVITWFRNRKALPIVLGALIIGLAMPWLTRPRHGEYPTWAGMPKTYDRSYLVWEPTVFTYLLLALAAAGLAWWGVQQKARAVVNYATIAFGAVVLWFYFSDLMDKLDRSLGLIGLGVLFLAGGFVLERLRRQLLATMTTTEAKA